ncbi:unnamed protein product [Dimorphilus gyrociliatus]|uniref:Profilin n=1 Tax=Dimorphilus gyrociliatus TaxID=2664684 RepID=A0A7I8V989_9ANNE|nr:unnamed protein product [Dimorphilus gyrociliatus]
MPTAWRDYIENSLLVTGWLKEAGIYGLTDGSCWAGTECLKTLQPLHVLRLSEAFIDSAEELLIGDKRFSCVQQERDVLLGKSTNGSGSCVICKGSKLLIISLCDNAQLGNAYSLVSRLVRYLRDRGY